MIRWGVILVGAALLPCAARADSVTTNAGQAFAAICSAAIDEKPDLVPTATAMGMEVPGGLKEAMTIGRTGIRVFRSPQIKQNIIITTNTYSDAREINCRSTLPLHTDRPELESLTQSLNLDGSFVEVGGALMGAWKRPGNPPFVMVSIMSNAASTVLSMQRIDAVAPGKEKK